MQRTHRKFQRRKIIRTLSPFEITGSTSIKMILNNAIRKKTSEQLCDIASAHLWPVTSFYTLWKHHKTSGFLMFSVNTEREHLSKMGQCLRTFSRCLSNVNLLFLNSLHPIGFLLSWITEAYPDPCHTSEMEVFAKLAQSALICSKLTLETP